MHTADYRRATEKAIEVLEEYDISRAPVSLRDIIQSLRREIKVISYSRIMKDKRISRQDIIDSGDSNLGFSVWRKRTNQYLIFYNDALPDETCRFTVAHELGHIFLGHHEKAGVDILKKGELDQQEYQEYEKEANNFARNFLSPAPLAAKVMKEFGGHEHDLETAFRISMTAAKIRHTYIRRDLRDYSLHMRAYVLGMKLMFGKMCGQCGTEVPKDAAYCPLCGSHDIRKGIPKALLPDGAPFGKEDHYLVCPSCGNTEITAGSAFCRSCGTLLNNFCIGSPDPETGFPISHRNPSYAGFCTVCGVPTRYSLKGLNGDFSMIKKIRYRDGVPFDKNTKKIEICPKCGNTEFSDDAQYCRICGTDLYNHCEGDNPFGTNHVNPSNARFCETCGARTFFYIQGILPDYTLYKEPEEGEEPEELQEEPEGLPFRRPEDDNTQGFMNIPDGIDYEQATGTDSPFGGIDEELPFN